MTPDELLAVCRFDPDGPLEASDMVQRDPEYYRLRYRVAPGAVVVSSSGWGAGWQELADGELLVVARGTLETSVLPGDRLVAARR